MLFKHWPQWKRELILGGIINITFVLCIIGIRYYFAKEEMDFLKEDSTRQESLIQENKTGIEKNSKNIISLSELDIDQYDKIAKLTEQIGELKTELIETKSKLDSLELYANQTIIKYGNQTSGVLPFEKEFGSQSNYLRIFGRTGFLMEDGKVIDSETNLSYAGSLRLPQPKIVKGDIKGEYFAEVPDSSFGEIRIRGRRSEPLKLKPPRNQISVGPFAGVIYDNTTGLTEPVIGFGITYNAFKVWDWR